jgi:hypothetical protein
MKNKRKEIKEREKERKKERKNEETNKKNRKEVGKGRYWLMLEFETKTLIKFNRSIQGTLCIDLRVRIEL